MPPFHDFPDGRTSIDSCFTSASLTASAFCTIFPLQKINFFKSVMDCSEMLYLKYFYPCALTNIRVLQMRIDDMKSMFSKVNNFSRSFYVISLRFHEEEQGTWYMRSCGGGGSCLGSASGSIRFSSSAKDVCKDD